MGRCARAFPQASTVCRCRFSIPPRASRCRWRTCPPCRARSARPVIWSAREAAAALVIRTHRIVGDAMSTGVLARELAASVAGGAAPTPCAPRPDLGDFVAWQAAPLAGAETERLRAFRRDELAGADAELRLPLDRPRPAAPSRRGARLRFQMGPEAASGLRIGGARWRHVVFRGAGGVPAAGPQACRAERYSARHRD